MLTPSFHLSQTDTHIIITINTPYIRVVGNLEVYVDSCDFHFYCKPYLLHLTFSHKLAGEDDPNRPTKATYDPNIDNGTITINACKLEEGQFFEGLDLITKLLQKKKKVDNFTEHVGSKPMIEVISSDDHEEAGVVSSKEEEEGMPGESSGSSAGMLKNLVLGELSPRYGFANQFQNVFVNKSWHPELMEMTDCPDSVPTSEQRRIMRLVMENSKMDVDRYLGDNCEEQMADDMIYLSAMEMIPHWMTGDGASHQDTMAQNMALLTVTDDQKQASSPSQKEPWFDKSERDALARIPHLETPPIESTTPLLLSLFDILYAYVYDHRMTQGDPTCESAWTVCILSPTFSWLENYHDHEDDVAGTENAMRYCVRRALIYPYLRNYDFAMLVLKDVACIFNKGRRVILRCLLQARGILEKTEHFYLWNKLYLDGYCNWIQEVPTQLIHDFADRINQVMNISLQVFDEDKLDLGIEHFEHLHEESDSDSEDDSDIDSDSEEESESSASDHDTLPDGEQQVKPCDQTLLDFDTPNDEIYGLGSDHSIQPNKLLIEEI